MTLTESQTKRVREIAENKARKFCIETNMEYVPNFMYMANIAILAALDDPLLNGYVEALEQAAEVAAARAEIAILNNKLSIEVKCYGAMEDMKKSAQSQRDKAREDALEQAAQVCDRNDGAYCAAVIRAMKKECGK